MSFTSHSRWRLMRSIGGILCMVVHSSHALAQFGLDQAVGRIDFATASEGPVSAGAPQFSTAPVAEPWGTLKAPGGGYPTLNLGTWNFVGGFVPPAMFNYVPVSSNAAGPAPFGAGATTMFAFANPSPGGGTGAFWSRFSVSDFGNDNEWSVNSSSVGVFATYKGQPRTAWAGAFVGVKGSLPLGAIGAVSIWGRIFQNGQLVGDPYVVIRTDGAGALPDQVLTGFASVGAGPSNTLFLNAGNPVFSAWGVQLFEVNLNPGDTFDVSANLTLAVDGPGAKMEVDLEMVPEVQLPEIGYVAIVPEPSSAAVLGTGLALAAALRRRRQR